MRVRVAGALYHIGLALAYPSGPRGSRLVWFVFCVLCFMFWPYILWCVSALGTVARYAWISILIVRTWDRPPGGAGHSLALVSR